MADPTPGQVRKPSGRPKGCKCNGSGVLCPVHPERYQGGNGASPAAEPAAPAGASVTDRLTGLLRGATGRPGPSSQGDGVGADAPPPQPGSTPPPPISNAGDPPPKPRAPKRRTNKATTAEIEQLLGALLVAPAVPMKMAFGCDYCMMHFLTEGPKAAHELALLSEDHPDLRRLLVRMHGAWTTITWGAILAAYIGKPILHHAAPDPFLAAAGPVLGVPPRPKREQGHTHAGQPGTAPPPDPERQQEALAAMDTAHAEAINAGLADDAADQFARGVAAAIMQGYTYDAALAAVWDAYREHVAEHAREAPPAPDADAAEAAQAA